LSTSVIERPDVQLDNSPPIDLPPFDTVRCRCRISCPLSDACDNESTQDDLLCDPCRKAADVMAAFRERTPIFSALTSLRYYKNLSHCHKCDPEFSENKENDGR